MSYSSFPLLISYHSKYKYKTMLFGPHNIQNKYSVNNVERMARYGVARQKKCTERSKTKIIDQKMKHLSLEFSRREEAAMEIRETKKYEKRKGKNEEVVLKKMEMEIGG